MSWKRRILVAAAIVVLAVVALISSGYLVPQRHVATSSAFFPRPPETVWQVITHFEGNARWRTGLDRVERLPDRDGMPVWREHSRSGVLTIRAIELQPPRRMVGEIVGDDLPFGGTWTYEVTPEARGCRVRLTEDGEIYNPAFRLVSRFVLGYNGTMETYLADLAEKLGVEPAQLESTWEHPPRS